MGVFIERLIKMKPFTTKIENILNIIVYGMMEVIYFLILPFSVTDNLAGKDNLGFIKRI